MHSYGSALILSRIPYPRVLIPLHHRHRTDCLQGWPYLAEYVLAMTNSKATSDTKDPDCPSLLCCPLYQACSQVCPSSGPARALIGYGQPATDLVCSRPGGPAGGYRAGTPQGGTGPECSGYTASGLHCRPSMRRHVATSVKFTNMYPEGMDTQLQVGTAIKFCPLC
jgi:hypothetical protein